MSESGEWECDYSGFYSMMSEQVRISSSIWRLLHTWSEHESASVISIMPHNRGMAMI